MKNEPVEHNDAIKHKYVGFSSVQSEGMSGFKYSSITKSQATSWGCPN